MILTRTEVNKEIPNFSIIFSVVIKVSKYTDGIGELDSGKGMIDIGKIEFDSSRIDEDLS